MRDRDLVRLYWPSDLRAAFDALFAINDAMADIVAQSIEPALGAIKLAWWRERLEELDKGTVAAEPRLRAAAQELLPRKISGSDLAALEAGWAGLLESPPDTVMHNEAGRWLFGLGARLLDVEPDDRWIGIAGRLFMMIQAGRRGIFSSVGGTPGPTSQTIPRQARPLTALAVLAQRDMERGGPPFEVEASPHRAWAILRHRLTGRFPR